MSGLEIFILFFAVVGLLLSIATVGQGTVVVITMFGKYHRVMYPGLNFKIPFFEIIHRRVSVQNHSVEMQFQAITLDQANVNFKSMLLYAVLDTKPETIQNVAFKFVDNASFMTSLVRTVEGSVRSFVATKRQSEILLLRREIVDSIKEQLDANLESWGYHLLDLQINDISFDEEIVRSMAQVVASSNLKAAAENQGQALLITKTREAEAEGNAVRIAAEAERTAAQLRGQGLALFREEVAKGMSKAAQDMKAVGLDASVIMFSMWVDAIKHFAEQGKGNVIFLDGSADGMKRTMQEMMAMSTQESQRRSLNQ